MNFVPFVASGLGLGAIYGMASVGLVLLYRASGTLNFAFGAIGAVGALVTWELVQRGVPDAPAWMAGILLSTAISFLYGRIVSARLIDRDRSVRAIATLGFALFLLGGLTSIWTTGLPRSLKIPLDRMYIVVLDSRVSYTRIGAFIFAIATVILVGQLLQRTRIGLAMRSLASNRSISGIIGIPVASVDSAAWLISGAFAGVSGLLLGDLVSMNPSTLVFLVIPAIAGAVIGGLTSMPRAFIGGMVCGLAEAILAGVGFASSYRSAAPYVIALIIIAVAGGRILKERE